MTSARERLRAAFQARDLRPFEEDWRDLLLRKPVPVTGVPLEAEEDWDVLRGRDSWFIALFEGDKQVPGTLRRFDYSPTYVFGVNAARPAEPTHIGHWKTGETPKLVPLMKPVSIGPITVSDYLYVEGGEVGYQHFYTRPINITGVWSFNNIVGPINITTGTTGTANYGNITITSWSITP